jgi:hypothetical protein
VISKSSTKIEYAISNEVQSRQTGIDFCGSQEFLLFVDQYDCQIVHEAELRPTNLPDAVRACQDTTLQIIRMDQVTWVGEDVSEDLANAWLDVHNPIPSLECTLPKFVLESDAWLHYLGDFLAVYGKAD